MIARIWHGFTTAANADKYETFLKTEFLPSIEEKHIEGYRKFQLLRKPAGEEVAFITIMFFDSLDKVKQFAGENYEQSVVHPKAAALLKHYDHTVAHFELVHELVY